MDAYRVSRILEWDAAHRVLGHGGKCRFLHGHRYKAEITVEPAELPDQLNKLSMVIDFSVIKTIIGEWIDKEWDHNILLHQEDPLLALLEFDDGVDDGVDVYFAGRSPYLMSPGENPTAEIIAKELFTQCELLLPETIETVAVVVWETPNCAATYYC